MRGNIRVPGFSTNWESLRPASQVTSPERRAAPVLCEHRKRIVYGLSRLRAPHVRCLQVSQRRLKRGVIQPLLDRSRANAVLVLERGVTLPELVSHTD